MKSTLYVVSADRDVAELLRQVNDEYHFHFSINPYLLPDSAVVFFIDLDGLEGGEQEAVHRLKQDYPGAPFIYIKTEYNPNEMRQLFKSGAADCLMKPLEKGSLYYLLHEWKNKLKECAPPQQNSRQMEKVKTSLRTSLAYDLIFGNVKNSKEIWDRSKLGGLSVVPNTAMVVHIDDFSKFTKNKSKLWEQSIRSEIICAIQHFLEQKVQEMLVIITAADKMAVLLSIPLQRNKLEYKKIAAAYAEEIKCYIKENTAYTVTVGIGNYYEDARNLHISYQEALHAQTYKFFSGKNAVIHVEDIEPFASVAGLLPNDKVASLANKLTVGDFVGVKKSIETLLDTMFHQRNVDPQTFKLQILDLLTTLARSAIEGGAKPKEIYSIHLQYARDLNTIENLEQMKHWFREVIENFLEQVLANHNEQMLKSVQKAISYIDSFYFNNLTLEEVANHVTLSPNYFSNIFKKTTGSSFVEYITQIRIEKAKAMLMDLDYTVYQIASEVGYNDSRYFSRVFKSFVGKTPSDYRNSLLVTKVSNKTASG